MIAQSIGGILARELRALRREVEAYADDAQPWQVVPGLANTGGTLVLHLAGNLQHYLGAVLGGTGYVRDRAAEFSRRDVPRTELLADIGRAEAAVHAALAQVTDAQLQADFPEPVAGMRWATGEFLMHLAVHAAYHLGQLDAHRRIVTGDPTGVGAIRPTELPSARPA
jgi:uncharacterized damage-inducible protein DinB